MSKKENRIHPEMTVIDIPRLSDFNCMKLSGIAQFSHLKTTSNHSSGITSGSLSSRTVTGVRWLPMWSVIT